MKTNNTPRIPANEKSPHTATLGILQLNRFGDLIQTLQAVEELKKSHPHYRIILIGRSQFTKPLDFLLSKSFHGVYHLDSRKIFDSSEVNGLKNSIGELNQFLKTLELENINALVNLSFSKSSSYLASVIKSQHKIGPFFDFSNKMQINDKWSQILYATVMRGSLNPYSLVDLFRNIIGIKASPASVKTGPSLSLTRTSNIVIHPFASHERKAWKSEKWVEVIYRTLKENEGATIQIVGAKNEILKSQLITESPLLKNYPHRIQNLTGKTTLNELFEHIKKARLFIGHDSMVGHLAAVAGTPSLTVSLGTVRPQETTPYHEKAYNLSPRTKCFPCFPSDQCGFTQCHLDIPHQVVSSSIKQLFDQKELSTEWIKNSISSFHLSSINLHRANLDNGQMHLENLTEMTADTSEVFRMLYKITWSFVILDSEENFPFPKLNPTTHRDLLDSMTGLQHLYELAEFGKKYSRYILEEISAQTPSITKIKEYSKKIDEIDHLQSLVHKTSPSLSPIIDYFTVRKGNLFGENVVALTESSFHAFEECAHLTSVMYELVEKTISEHKLSSGKSTRPDINK